MSSIVIVDTSVLLNILDVPRRNQNRLAVLDCLGAMIESGDHLCIPMAAVAEVGNHIAQVSNGALRWAAAQRFVREVRKALSNEAPWKPINFPSNEEVLAWLDAFPESATRGVGMGDLAIRMEWQKLCDRHPLSRVWVWVWSLDADLANLDRLEVTKRRR